MLVKIPTTSLFIGIQSISNYLLKILLKYFKSLLYFFINFFILTSATLAGIYPIKDCSGCTVTSNKIYYANVVQSLLPNVLWSEVVFRAECQDIKLSPDITTCPIRLCMHKPLPSSNGCNVPTAEIWNINYSHQGLQGHK